MRRRVYFRDRARARKGVWVLIAIFGVGLALTVGIPLYQNLSGAPTGFDRIDAAREQNRPLWARIGVPQAATPHNTLVEDVYRRKSTIRVGLEQEFAMAGGFVATIAWYRKRFEEMGWVPFDRERWRDFVVYFCQAPWIATVARRADYATDRTPSHRFALRLDWNDGMGPSECPP